ncbi:MULTISPECIES: PaaI family thioesterase [unclassified Micromonospora]|uniref:PaaI family thioesterase n=1 Tax=unclassified Micromonospora TaxID=2617518 RepID=UPI0033AA397E
MEELLALGRRMLADQPFSSLIGASLSELTTGHAVLQVPIVAGLTQQDGHLHGGVVSYAADNALTFAGGSVLGAAVLTSEFKVNYLRPARGVTLVARARAVHWTRRQAVCVCELWAVDDAGVESLCAVAQGTIVRSTRAGGGIHS